MIKRIVKMSFIPEKVEAFKQVFSRHWTQIRDFKGCSHVELLQDLNNPSVFFTYSIWESEDHVNCYRNSELFKTVWGATKIHFNARPEAWSLTLFDPAQ